MIILFLASQSISLDSERELDLRDVKVMNKIGKTIKSNRAKA